MNTYARVSDDAVRKATGRDWNGWLRLLDAQGAKSLSHKEIVALVGESHGIGPWWRQMVAVGYEQARGLREKHQTKTGYVANVSRTFAVPVSQLFAAWADGRRRAKWLGEKVTIRTKQPDKSIRITWSDGATSVEVGFMAKGPEKSQVAVQHSKLADAKDVARLKAFWSDALARLRETLA
jgi:hypothetical protein